VKLVVTNLGLFEPVTDGFLLREIAPGVTIEEIEAATGCAVIVARPLDPVRLTSASRVA
jgi:3-oxoacid CoA-transferase subunit B